MTEIVYVLTNPTMPGLIKIGRTTNLEQRVKSLSSDTGVPLPFEVFYACSVRDANEVERALHNAFGDHRINPKREFFELDPERVYPVLKLVCVEDVTPRSSLVDDPEERAALEKEKNKKRAPFRFSYAQVPVGGELRFIRDESITAIVADDKKIMFRDELTSVSGAALTVMQELENIHWTQIAGPTYWLYEGETLSDRRKRIEAMDEDED